MDQDSILIGFAGDVMLGRGVNHLISHRGYLHPWGDVLPVLKSTNMNIGNLETTLTNSEKEVFKVFNFKATPDKVKCLTEANFGMVNLANNHILDYSEEGLIETIITLDAAGIKHVGTGMNIEKASQPAIMVIKNISVGLLGFTDNEETWKAGAQSSGINYINVSNKAHQAYALSAIQQIRKDVDILVVSIHWGPNMRNEPHEDFIQFAHKMVEHGADIVHGHSAHVFQGIEVYKGKLILYDTGDFIDDYVVDPFLRNNHSFFYLVEANKNGILRLKLVPVVIDNYQVNLARNDDQEWNIKRVQQLSARFKTRINNDGEVLLSETAG